MAYWFFRLWRFRINSRASGYCRDLNLNHDNTGKIAGKKLTQFVQKTEHHLMLNPSLI